MNVSSQSPHTDAIHTLWQRMEGRPRMARNSNVSLEVADQLAAAVREVRRLVFGGDGVPEWGTRFARIESEGMAVGLEFARLFMEQAVDEQGDRNRWLKK